MTPESYPLQTEQIPPPAPPLRSLIWTWGRRNLFSTWYNSLLTLLCLWGLFWFGSGLIRWATTQAQWAVVAVNLRAFLVGRFPAQLNWRLWIMLALIALTLGMTWGMMQRCNRWSLFAVGIFVFSGIVLVQIAAAGVGPNLWLLGIGGLAIAALWGGDWLRTHPLGIYLSRGLSLLWFLTFFVVLWLLSGGWGLTPVSTSLWNGLLLTVLMAGVSIVLSFPVGVLLALGRRSSLPVIRTLCVLYIETIRGLPLIGILFMSQVMLPLVLPIQVQLDSVLRAIAGLTLFSAAYLAENVRGGLQSIPKGQVEAAQALGFHSILILWLIVLPQALRAVIPAIVGQFIGLFKDTSLLSIVGLVELTGIARSILSQPQFLGRYAEVYLFIALIYWLFCYLMSLGSRRLERQLGVN